MLKMFWTLLSSLLFVAALSIVGANAQEDELFPYYASLASDNVNMRRGPGLEHDVVFKYRRNQLPIELLDRYRDWYKVRDHEGDTGWIYKNLIRKKRTALVIGEVPYKRLEVFESATETAEMLALLGQNVVVVLHQCRRGWCNIQYRNVNGWVRKSGIWGYYE